MKPVVVVGAGPAGVRAAQTLVAHGLRPILLDEALRSGGQIYRRQPANFKRSPAKLYGFEAPKANALHRTLDGLLDQLDYRPETLVWNAEDHALDTLQQGRAARLEFSRVIVATGATDRILPVPGWTLPGVYSLGAAQIALKFQGCAIGERVAFAGSGPLLYLVAYQYAKAGAKVVAVLDSSPFSAQVRATGQLLRQPATLAKGIYYRAWLTAHGIPLHQGATLHAIDGSTRVQSLSWRDANGDHALDCDAVAFAHGLRSETQLADLLGCQFDWNPLNRAWLPQRDRAGRSSVAEVYLAGDGAGIMGADAAEMAGERAALALLQDIGYVITPDRAQTLERSLQRIEGFRRGLEQAFAFPEDWAKNADDQLMLCRCEEVRVGDVRQVVREGHWEINRAKAHCRVGMGRCQGRMCGAAAAEIIACESQRPLNEIGRLRAQAPIKPLPFGVELDG